MKVRALRVGLAVLIVAASAAGAQASPPEPEVGRLRAHVATLAAPEYGGRRGEGGRKAAAYIEAAFRSYGLEPLFDGQFTQEIPGPQPGSVAGRNVGAYLAGSDPERRDEWIIVSAHFDHLGVINGVLYPGADDDASGVAMLLEVARCLSRQPEGVRRNVIVLAFDLEELGLFGSRWFVEHSPVPLDQVRLFITADMIGRALGGVCEPLAFVMGTENAPALRPWIEAAAQGRDVRIGLLGTDLLLVDRSDYGPFRARKIPYLFFSTGENPHYHRPSDTADTINYPKLEAISRVIYGVVRRAASADALPNWSPEPDHPVAEVAILRDVLRTLLDHREGLQIKPGTQFLMRNTLRSAEAVLKRGAMTSTERSVLLRAAQIIMFSIF